MATHEHKFEASTRGNGKCSFLTFSIRTAFTPKVQDEVERRKQQVQVGDIQGRNQQNPFLWPVGPHEKCEEGEKKRDTRNHRMVAINAFALIAEAYNGTAPIHDSEMKRGEQEKASHHCYQDPHVEQIIEVFV